jgi:hypothetical protein
MVGVDGKNEIGNVGMPLGDRLRIARRRRGKGRAAARVIGQLPAEEGSAVGVTRNDSLKIILEEVADSLISIELVMRLCLGELSNVGIHATIVIGKEIAREGRRGPACRRFLGYGVPVVGQ